ncbi:MAG: MFS transporter [Candidatus Moranbacteria bacterium]|nr:MFS transporter [Candidatus Moranbacteria bacterium]
MIHKDNFNRNKVLIVSAVSFLLGFFDAFCVYILSSYLAKISGTDNVGIFYITAFVGVLLSLFYLQPLIRKIGKARMFYFSLGLAVLLSALLTNMPPTIFSLVVAILFLVVNSVTWVALDILLEGFSSDGMAGRVRGLHLTVVNTGFLIAPFLATRVLDRFEYEGVFFVMTLGYIIVFLASLLIFRHDNASVHEGLRPWQALRKMLREKNLFHIYCVALAIEFFYSIMIIYMPLHLLHLGFSWKDIGIIFTIMLLPFVLLQYPVGALADKRLGEKEMLMVGIMIIMFSTALLPFLDSSYGLLVWGGVLFLTRVGAAMIDVLRDAYFYKQIDGDDADIISFFRTARPLANVVGAAIAAFILIFFPIKSLFFVIVLVFIFALVSAILLEDTQGEEECGKKA